MALGRSELPQEGDPLGEALARGRGEGAEGRRQPQVGEGGGNDHEEIEVFLVAREDIPEFIAQRRAADSAVDVKLLLFASY